MDYKKLIKSRAVRLKILRFLSFVPDKMMLKIQYRIKTGRRLNLKSPKRFTEKLQWYKLYYKNPLMIQCVDKYDVREFVRKKGLESILIPCYGVFESVEEINWDMLPDSFVMKDTLGSGGNSVIIVPDKSNADIEMIRETAREWTRINAHKKDGGREWPYYSGKNHRIIIEEYIDSSRETGGLIDYKFFCFDGEPRYIYIIADRVLGNGAGFGVFDSDFNKLNVTREDERPLERIIAVPRLFEAMKKVSQKLSNGFLEARIDLYCQNDTIYFGEMTFFDGSGYMKFSPDEFDEEIGSAFTLPDPNKGGYFGTIIIRSESLGCYAGMNHGLIDYKFFCFDGKTEFVYAMGDREVGQMVRVGLFDRNFKKIPVLRDGDEDIDFVSIPQDYEKMLKVAEILSAEFPHVRVDLYDVGGKVYFGELTFFNASGYMKYKPDKFDVEIGRKFKLQQM